MGELASECGVLANIGDCEAVDSAACGEPRIGVPATSGERRIGDPTGPRAAGVIGDGEADGDGAADSARCDTGDASPGDAMIATEKKPPI